jgi:GABA permease
MLSVIAAMALLPSTQTQFVMSGVTLVVILLSYELRRRYGKRPGEEAGNDAADLPADPSMDPSAELDPSAEGLHGEPDKQPAAARP